MIHWPCREEAFARIVSRDPDMLTFEHETSSFVFHGVRIGPSVPVTQLAAGLGVSVQDKPDDRAWSFVKVDDRPVGAFVAFLEGKINGGYFWVDVPSAGWNDYERAEQQRRRKHECLMYEMFGTLQYDDQFLSVDLVRDPRSGLEQIRFETGERLEVRPFGSRRAMPMRQLIGRARCVA